MVLKTKFPFKNIIIISVLIIILIIVLIFIKPKNPKDESELQNEPPEIKKLDKEQRQSFKNRDIKQKFYKDSENNEDRENNENNENTIIVYI